MEPSERVRDLWYQMNPFSALNKVERKPSKRLKCEQTAIDSHLTGRTVKWIVREASPEDQPSSVNSDLTKCCNEDFHTPVYPSPQIKKERQGTLHLFFQMPLSKSPGSVDLSSYATSPVIIIANRPEIPVTASTASPVKTSPIRSGSPGMTSSATTPSSPILSSSATRPHTPVLTSGSPCVNVVFPTDDPLSSSPEYGNDEPPCSIHEGTSLTSPSAEAALTSKSLPQTPNHPTNLSSLPIQRLRNRSLKFQAKWFKEFPWLHFEPNVDGVLCHTCVIAAELDLLKMSKYKEQTFISRGFKNWKKGIEKFTVHQKSICHNIANANLFPSNEPCDVNAQLGERLSQGQIVAQKSLVQIIEALQYLTQQGLPLRGNDDGEGNFTALLNLFSSRDGDFKTWLQKKTNYTSGLCQNEILQLLSHHILRSICKDVQSTPFFGVIVDGTRDCTGTEQKSICIRFMDEVFDIKDEFVGLYQMNSTTGADLARMIVDVLTRLQLPIDNLRAQAYCGAGNISGCQAEIKKIQPLATDLVEQKQLSSMLLKGDYHQDLVDRFPELETLHSELTFFRTRFPRATIEEYRQVFKGMCPEVRQKFPRVEALLRLVLISPASPCEAERSFSTLRGIKTWLRTTMSQERLNHLMICSVHKERLSTVDSRIIAEEFVSNNEDTRRRVFGKFHLE